jgi:hypothetical protein
METMIVYVDDAVYARWINTLDHGGLHAECDPRHQQMGQP